MAVALPIVVMKRIAIFTVTACSRQQQLCGATQSAGGNSAVCSGLRLS
jgi:hypothetical protein